MRFCSSLLALTVLLSVGCSREKQVQTAEAPPAAPGKQPDKPPAQPAAPPSTVIARIQQSVLTGDLPEIAKRRFLRVLVVPDRLGFVFDSGELKGMSFELMREFESELNKKLGTQLKPIAFVYIPVHRTQLLPMISEGRGDIALGRIAVTEAGKKLVDFSDSVFDNAEGIVITGPGGPDIKGIDDLSGKEAYVFEGVGASELLAPINAKFQKEGKPPLKITPADPNLTTDDLLEMVNAGLIPMTVAERNVAEIWSSVMPNLKLHPDIVVARGQFAWAIRKNTPQLQAAANEFLKTHKYGTAFGSTVARRYYKNSKWVRNAKSAEDLAKFNQMSKYFQTYGTQYSFPYLLVAAQSYQESRFNQNLKSPVGAVGVMQIKPDTAASKPVGIPDVHKVDRNIEAGVKYLRYVQDHFFADAPMDPINKGLFAIASYNAGPAKIQKLRKEAEERGFDPNIWFNNVEVIASERIGRETVNYVANIFKYYLAYKMVTDTEASRAAAKAAVTSAPKK